MTRRWRPLALLLLVAVATGCLSGGPLTGKPAPPFAFVTSDGTYVNETTYLGRFLILDLMATWCGPCKLEVAHLREVQRLHGDKVVIVSIGTDGDEDLEDLEAFGEEYGATWPYVIDRDGVLKDTMKMRVIPKLIVIDPQGVVVLEREGEVLPAAMTRVIDPGSAPAAGSLALAAIAALAAGFLAALNPYRRAHRNGPGGGPTLAALGILAALAILAWPFAGLASTRATYGSLFIGALTLLAAGWWLRARRKLGEPVQGTPAQRAMDRTYELGPHFAATLLLALVGVGGLGFFAPFAAFFVGAVGGLFWRPHAPPRLAEALGLVGLVAVGAGLLVFGARVLSVL